MHGRVGFVHLASRRPRVRAVRACAACVRCVPFGVGLAGATEPLNQSTRLTQSTHREAPQEHVEKVLLESAVEILEALDAHKDDEIALLAHLEGGEGGREGASDAV
jgi:hypothetical protein